MALTSSGVAGIVFDFLSGFGSEGMRVSEVVPLRAGLAGGPEDGFQGLLVGRHGSQPPIDAGLQWPAFEGASFKSGM